MGRAVHRGRDLGTLHGVLRLRDRLPLRRPRLQRQGRGLQALPRRHRRRARQLHPRPQGLHAVHAGLPPLPHLGARHRDAPLRAAPHRRRGHRHLAPDGARPGHRRRRAGHRPGRRPGVGPPHLGLRARRDRRRAGLGARGRRLDLEGGAPGGLEQGGRARHGRLPLHLLGEPAGLPRGHRRRGRAHRPRGHGLPGQRPSRHGRPARRERSPGASPSRSACCAPRPSTTPSSPSSSRRSTGWPGPTSSR